MNTTVKADSATLKAAAKVFSEALEKVKGFEGVVFSFTLQPYALWLLEKTSRFGGNIMNLNSKNGPLISILILMFWKNASDDEIILTQSREVLAAIDQDAEARGTIFPYKYLNYAFSFQDPINSYGEENKKVMLEVSKKYDPNGLFQKGAVGGFKLSASQG